MTIELHLNDNCIFDYECYMFGKTLVWFKHTHRECQSIYFVRCYLNWYACWNSLRGFFISELLSVCIVTQHQMNHPKKIENSNLQRIFFSAFFFNNFRFISVSSKSFKLYDSCSVHIYGKLIKLTLQKRNYWCFFVE